MSTTIHKYPLGPPGHLIQIRMPELAKALHVGVQDEMPTIWALVDPERPLEVRSFLVYGTGWEVDERAWTLPYLGTVQTPEGLVWHVFEEPDHDPAA